MPEPRKILYTIPNFDTAGSGKALINIANRLDRSRFEPHICCSHDRGIFFKEVIASGIGRDKKICIGGVTHRTLQVETPHEVAALIKRALEFIDLDRLLISSDCGFGRQGMSRMHAFYKMVSLVKGVNLVRKELGLDVTEAPAALGRYDFLR